MPLERFEVCPFSRQTMYSGVIERLTGTAGLSGSAGAVAGCPIPVKRRVHLVDQAGISAVGTVLLLT